MTGHTLGYEITKDGHVFSVLHNWRGYGPREMRQSLNTDGYPSVRLTIYGKRKRVTIHRLVVNTFLAERPGPEYEIRHLNGNKTDNRVENLVWGTKQDNADDRERHGHTSRGPAHSVAIKQGIATSHAAIAKTIGDVA